MITLEIYNTLFPNEYSVSYSPEEGVVFTCLQECKEAAKQTQVGSEIVIDCVCTQNRSMGASLLAEIEIYGQSLA